MVEFHSHLEDIMQAEELRFDPTPAFGQYNSFLKQALPHPAKANTKLLKFLIEHFTKEGDTILDPMCGSGSTGVVAALLNRNAVQVDIEKKFVDWAEEAKQKVESQATLTPKGLIQNICGDARKLAGLLQKTDVILTSPPYAETISKHAGGPPTLRKGFKRGITTDTARGYDVIVTSPPYSESLNESKNTPSNLKREGRLKTHGHRPKDFFGGKARNCQLENGLRYSHNPENIGNLPHGNVDAVITSPPYGEAQEGSGIAKKGYRGKKHSPTDLVGNRSYMPDKFESAENISKLKYDAIITSPPYAGTLEDRKGNQKGFDEGKGITHNGRKSAQGAPTPYSTNKENIGNLKKETYLEAMLKVYSEMYKVLKSNGLGIIVIKPFIRNKKVVDLPWHTWLLLEKVGFKLAKLYKLRLKNPSFWRILYTKKYPGVPEIKHEYVLVCQK